MDNIVENIRKDFNIKRGQKVNITTPTHGPCCTCQTCGYSFEDCECEINRYINLISHIEELQSKNNKQAEFIRKYLDGKRPMTIAEARERALWSIDKRRKEKENNRLKEENNELKEENNKLKNIKLKDLI